MIHRPEYHVPVVVLLAGCAEPGQPGSPGSATVTGTGAGGVLGNVLVASGRQA